MVGQIYDPDYTEALMGEDLWLALVDDRIVGSASWTAAGDTGRAARITGPCVDPIFTRLGIGRRLLALAEERARAAGFDVFTVRAPFVSVGFFDLLGYKISSHGAHAIGTEHGFPIIYLRKLDQGPPATL